MNGISLMLPVLLLVHNIIDFGQNGAPESYKNRLNCVITEYIEAVEDQNNLKLVNKTGCFDDMIWKLGLQFESTEDYGIDEARMLILGLIDTLLMTVNDTPQLRPYLPHCSLTAAQLEIRVNFIGLCKYNYPDPGQIKYVVFKNGKITYYIQGRDCLSQLDLVRNEPLEFARLIAPGPYYSNQCNMGP